VEAYELKFDIYERVHLTDNDKDIELIESTELTPQIKMLLHKETFQLVGKLLLKIRYVGGDLPWIENEFEHSIPVEITIPIERVKDAWLLDADIVNFNVEQVGSRALNVTGVMKVYEKESVRVEKVKLPRKVGEAIEDMRAKGLPLNEIVERHINKDHILVNNVECVGFLSTDTLIRALYIGYEVEETPEDRIRALFNTITPEGWKFNNNPQDSIYLQRSAVRTVLDILNIKIEGVNT
jgi:hypothetical protein